MGTAFSGITDVDQFRTVDRHFSDDAELWTALYGRRDVFALGFQIRLRQALEFAQSVPDRVGRRALEVGCGGGLASLALGRMGFDVIGLDMSDRMVDTARANLNESRKQKTENRKQKVESWNVERSGSGARGRVSFLAKNFVESGMEGGSFDLVMGLGVFEYFPDGLAVAAEVGRVLRSGGYLIMTAPNPERLSFRVARGWSRLSRRFWRVQRLARRLRAAMRGVVEPPSLAEGFRRNSVRPDDFDRLWADHGFTRIGYAGNGLGYGADGLGGIPWIGDRVAGLTAGWLASVSRNRLRALARVSSGYMGFYQKQE